jgi:hypothetical protein
MTALTSGHLSSNGGLRGHSTGDIYPWRVMGQGTMDNLRWHVIKPNGDKLGEGQYTPKSAYKVARMAHALWLRQGAWS